MRIVAVIPDPCASGWCARLPSAVAESAAATAGQRGPRSPDRGRTPTRANSARARGRWRRGVPARRRSARKRVGTHLEPHPAPGDDGSHRVGDAQGTPYELARTSGGRRKFLFLIALQQTEWESTAPRRPRASPLYRLLERHGSGSLAVGRPALRERGPAAWPPSPPRGPAPTPPPPPPQLFPRPVRPLPHRARARRGRHGDGLSRRRTSSTTARSRSRS